MRLNKLRKFVFIVGRPNEPSVTRLSCSAGRSIPASGVNHSVRTSGGIFNWFLDSSPARGGIRITEGVHLSKRKIDKFPSIDLPDLKFLCPGLKKCKTFLSEFNFFILNLSNESKNFGVSKFLKEKVRRKRRKKNTVGIRFCQWVDFTICHYLFSFRQWRKMKE